MVLVEPGMLIKALIVISWHQNILFIQSRRDLMALKIIDTFRTYYCLLLFSAFLFPNFKCTFVYHSKSLFIFHTKVFLYVKLGKSGVKKKRKKSRIPYEQETVLTHNAALIRSIFSSLSRCSPVIPHTCHRCLPFNSSSSTFNSLLLSLKTMSGFHLCDAVREKRGLTELIKMKLNKDDCQTSIVRLEVFLLLNAKLLKEWDLCI